MFLNMTEHVHSERFREAIKKIDAANAEDPRTELVDGMPQPRELLFAQRVYEWVCKIVDDPSEELLLSARAHTLRRWMIARDQYPRNRAGYHKWRKALAQFHAKEAEAILQDVGYPDEIIQRVRDFVTRSNWPKDLEARTLEDADCLVFLETKLQDYIDSWDKDKAVQILKKSLWKMTPEGRALACQLNLGDREGELVQQAMRLFDSESVE